MSGTVKKIFLVLIVAIVMLIIGGVVINVLVPNGINGVVNAVEQSIHGATGLNIDFNGDGVGNNAQYDKKDVDNEFGNVDGFQ